MQPESVDLMYNQIIEEANKEAESLLQKAKTSAQQRIQLATQESEGNAKKIIERANQDCSQIEKKVMSSIQIEKRKLILKKEEELIGQILAGAKNELKVFSSGPDYRKYLKVSLINSALQLEETKISVIAGKNDPEKLVTEVLREAEKEISSKSGRRISFQLDAAKHNGSGFIIRTMDGSIQINNTLQEKLNSQIDEIRAYINERLFK